MRIVRNRNAHNMLKISTEIGLLVRDKLYSKSLY